MSIRWAKVRLRGHVTCKKLFRVARNDVLHAVNKIDALFSVFLGVIQVFPKVRNLPNIRRFTK